MAADKWEQAKETFTDWFDYQYDRIIRHSPDARAAYRQRIRAREEYWNQHRDLKAQRRAKEIQRRKREIEQFMNDEIEDSLPLLDKSPRLIVSSPTPVYIHNGEGRRIPIFLPHDQEEDDPEGTGAEKSTAGTAVTEPSTTTTTDAATVDLPIGILDAIVLDALRIPVLPAQPPTTTASPPDMSAAATGVDSAATSSESKSLPEIVVTSPSGTRRRPHLGIMRRMAPAPPRMRAFFSRPCPSAGRRLHKGGGRRGGGGGGGGVSQSQQHPSQPLSAFSNNNKSRLSSLPEGDEDGEHDESLEEEDDAASYEESGDGNYDYDGVSFTMLTLSQDGLVVSETDGGLHFSSSPSPSPCSSRPPPPLPPPVASVAPLARKNTAGAYASASASGGTADGGSTAAAAAAGSTTTTSIEIIAGREVKGVTKAPLDEDDAKEGKQQQKKKKKKDDSNTGNGGQKSHSRRGSRSEEEIARDEKDRLQREADISAMMATTAASGWIA